MKKITIVFAVLISLCLQTGVAYAKGASTWQTLALVKLKMLQEQGEILEFNNRDLKLYLRNIDMLDGNDFSDIAKNEIKIAQSHFSILGYV